MSEELIVRQCSPTLAGLKTGSLFTCPYRSEAELTADIAALNRRLEPKGVRIRVLRLRKRALLYLYRLSSLRRDFAADEVAALLRQYGYAAEDAETCVSQLSARLAGGGSFPHEIGLFLGYPAHDVRSFIENPNDGYLYVVDVDDSIVYHNIKLVQPSALPDDYLPESDSYYMFEPIPAEDAEELMTYELTIPFKERNRFEDFLRKVGFPVSALKKVASSAAVF